MPVRARGRVRQLPVALAIRSPRARIRRRWGREEWKWWGRKLPQERHSVPVPPVGLLQAGQRVSFRPRGRRCLRAVVWPGRGREGAAEGRRRNPPHGGCPPLRPRCGRRVHGVCGPVHGRAVAGAPWRVQECPQGPHCRQGRLLWGHGDMGVRGRHTHAPHWQAWPQPQLLPLGVAERAHAARGRAGSPQAGQHARNLGC